MEKESARLYSPQEVSLHSSEDDCWLIMDGKSPLGGGPRVYDVTNFLKFHPGGKDLILDAAVAGQDCHQLFKETGHSNHARRLLRKYYIGHLSIHGNEQEQPSYIAPATTVTTTSGGGRVSNNNSRISKNSSTRIISSSNLQSGNSSLSKSHSNSSQKFDQEGDEPSSFDDEDLARTHSEDDGDDDQRHNTNTDNTSSRSHDIECQSILTPDPATLLSKKEKRKILYDRIARHTVTVLLALDLVTTAITLWAIGQPVECCGEDIFSSRGIRGGMMIIAWVFLGAVVVEGILHLADKTSYALMVFNPILGYVLTIGLIASSNYVESIVTVGLETISFGLEAYALGSVKYEHNERCRKYALRGTQVLAAFLALLSVLLLGHAVYYGGICVQEYDSGFDLAEGLVPTSCRICPKSATPVPPDDIYCVEDLTIESPTLGDFCEDSDDLARFCFIRFSIV